ncbi:MAG TPA: signal peptidase I [Gammaproteobacteria bacterium]|nr:signal peptidase I [Gammaproteobacteria bacterium]
MDFDFEALLTGLTLLAGAVWLVDALFFAKVRRLRRDGSAQEQGDSAEKNARKPRDPVLVDYAKSFFPVLLVVLLLRSFLLEPFHIPSSSMVPTLLVGDFILVNKFDYGLRLPVLHTKILNLGEPQRGDVVVFHFPEKSARSFCEAQVDCAISEVKKSAGTDFIKRVIGLPGDQVVYRDKTLYINGVKMATGPVGPYDGPDSMGGVLNVEELGNVKHDTVTLPGYTSREGEWTVPPHEYFVMGDNRDNSWDSRYWGFVPERNLVGKAFFIWMNWDAFSDSRLWSRIGDSIH